MTRQYTVRELRNVIKESTKEYNPVKYNDDNDKINKEAYKNADKLAKDAQKGFSKKIKTENYPQNTRGMETLRPLNATKAMQDNYDAQAEGYFNAAHKKAHKNEELGNAQYNDGSISKALKQRAKDESDSHKKAVEIGLTGRESGAEKQQQNEGKISKLTFKRTKFLTEAHMLSKVPDNYKSEGRKFIMKDSSNHEYLVEWHEEPKVIDKTYINEEQNRIKELFNYKSNVVTSSNKTRMNETKSFESVLNKARKLMY